MARTQLVPKGTRKSIEFANETWDFLTDESRQRSALERAAIPPQAVLHEYLVSIMTTGSYIGPDHNHKPNQRKRKGPGAHMRAAERIAS